MTTFPLVQLIHGGRTSFPDGLLRAVTPSSFFSLAQISWRSIGALAAGSNFAIFFFFWNVLHGSRGVGFFEWTTLDTQLFPLAIVVAGIRTAQLNWFFRS